MAHDQIFLRGSITQAAFHAGEEEKMECRSLEATFHAGEEEKMESFQQLHPKCQWQSHLHGLRDSTAQATVSAFTLTVGSRVAWIYRR